MSDNKQCMAVQICPISFSVDPQDQYGIVKISPKMPNATPEPNCNIIEVCTIQGMYQVVPNDNGTMFVDNQPPPFINNQDSNNQPPVNNQVPTKVTPFLNNQLYSLIYDQVTPSP